MSVQAAAVDGGVVAVPHVNKSIALKSFELSNETVLRINLLHKMLRPPIHTKASTSSDFVMSADTTKHSDITWVQYGCYKLTKQHRSLLCGNGLLDVCLIGASQFLIKKQFPEIGGLNNTLILTKLSLMQPFEYCANLQIVHREN